MRIQPINSFIPMRMQRQKQNDSNLSFLGKLTPQQVKKFSLEKKLPYMFEHCQNGDVIAVGKNIAEIKKGLANVVENFTEVIKRILFIKHGGLSVPMAFGKDFADSWSCVNIGDKKKPLYSALYKAIISVEKGICADYCIALEQMAEECRCACVSNFVSLVVQNSRKGNSFIVQILINSASFYRSERKNTATKLAGEATTLMLLPSAAILVAMILLMVAPAIIQMIGGL